MKAKDALPPEAKEILRKAAELAKQAPEKDKAKIIDGAITYVRLHFPRYFRR